jgi:DNA-directed RNA polymerase subunit H (RpoH/RPB5)
MEEISTPQVIPTPKNTTQLKSLITQMDMDLKTVDRYFKIHRTVVEMLQVRGYHISNEENMATNNLHDFMKYLFSQKNRENKEIISNIIQELIHQKHLIDDRNQLDRFLSQKIEELSNDMNGQVIASEIKKHFKISSKMSRDVEDVLEDKLKNYDMSKTIEYLNQIYSKDTGEKIFSYYHFNSESEKKEGKKRINDVIRDILEIQKKYENIKDILFISESKMNTQMIDDLKRYTEKMKIHIFLGDHLLFNITKHFLVPKHHLMTSDETKMFLKDKEKGFIQKLPKIYETDPISRFYGAKAGQIFKITRENLSDDSMIQYSEFYRYVTPEIKK